MLAAAAQARGVAVAGRARRGRQQRVQRQRLAVRAARRHQARALAAAAVAAAARARPRQRRQVLPAGVRGARRPHAPRLPARLLPAAAGLPATPALRVPPAAAAAAAALLGHPGVRGAAPADAGALRPPQARALPEPRRRPARAARRVQPVHEQGPRDPLAGVPAEHAAAEARRRQTEEISEPP